MLNGIFISFLSHTKGRLRHSKRLHVERCQEWTHRRLSTLLRLTLHHRRRADRARARSRRCALHGRWAIHCWASGSRARRTLSRILLTRTIINDHRLRLGNTALQYILTQVGHRRALSLQHIISHIRHQGVRRGHLRLQYILAQIRLHGTRARRNGRRLRRPASTARLWLSTSPTNRGHV